MKYSLRAVSRPLPWAILLLTLPVSAKGVMAGPIRDTPSACELSMSTAAAQQAWQAYSDAAATRLRFSGPEELRSYFRTKEGAATVTEGLTCIPVWQGIASSGTEYAAFRIREKADSTTDAAARADERRAVTSLWFLLSMRALDVYDDPMLAATTYSLWSHAKAISESTVGSSVYLAPAYWAHVGDRLGFPEGLGSAAQAADQVAIWSTGEALSQISVLAPEVPLTETEVASRLVSALAWWRTSASYYHGAEQVDRMGNLLFVATLGAARLRDGFLPTGSMSSSAAAQIRQTHERAIAKVQDEGLSVLNAFLQDGTPHGAAGAREMNAGDHLMNEVLSAKLATRRVTELEQKGAGCAMSAPASVALSHVLNGDRVRLGEFTDRDIVWANQLLAYELSQLCASTPNQLDPLLADRFTSSQAMVWRSSAEASCGLAEREAVCGLIGQTPWIGNGVLASAWRTEWADRCMCTQYPPTTLPLTR